MRRATILVVDDHKAVCDVLQQALSEDGYDVRTAHSGREAVEALQQARPELILLDLRLPDVQGLGALQTIRAHDADVPVIALITPADQEIAIRALQAGALAYIQKPVNLDYLEVLVQKALGSSSGGRELSVLRRRSAEESDRSFVRGDSPAMLAVLVIAEQIARSTSPVVLLEGEAGSGKSTLAAYMHRISARQAGPFLEINCSGFPSAVLERELFGAGGDRPGLFELADNGTLCLSQIDGLPGPLQETVLRVLEKGTLPRAGQRTEAEFSARIIATTSLELTPAAARGTMHAGLARRLTAVPIRLPALRGRGDDVVLLARQFIAEFSAAFAKKFTTFSPDALTALGEYPWPGNVRELRNLLERVILLESGEIVQAGMLGLPTSVTDVTSGDALSRLTRVLKSPGFPDQGLPTEDLLNDLERTLIERASEAAQGNQTRTAQLLGMKRDRLRYRMKQFGLQMLPQRDREAA